MDRTFRSDCAMASTLDILGDKWSLLVIRNLMLGARSFRQIQSAPEGIATNILSDRLKRLVEAGLIVEQRADAGSGARGRYALTPAGADLLPVLQAIAVWGRDNIPNRRPIPPEFLTITPAELLARDQPLMTDTTSLTVDQPKEE